MRKLRMWVKVVGLTAVLAVSSGYAYASYQADQRIQRVVVEQRITVESGDTFEGVIGEVYDYKTDGAWDAWRCEMRKQNMHLFKYADGSSRSLQIGDVIVIKKTVKVNK